MTGKVYLIGAGCGEADLITLKGLKKLLESDVVLYDSLVDEELINKLSENVEKIYVGKRYHQKSMPQDEINDLIIKYAKSGKIVTRLKGGDPYVFGRGSEEAQAIEKENISYEVIPGISSAIAVPELAGIPLTHRQLSRNFTVLTASSVGIDNKENITPIDYQALTKIGGTIVFLMGYHHIPEIMNNFLNSGMNKNTPCAIISKGCTKEQKVIKGNIKTGYIIGDVLTGCILDYKINHINVLYHLKENNPLDKFIQSIILNSSQYKKEIYRLKEVEII